MQRSKVLIVEDDNLTARYIFNLMIKLRYNVVDTVDMGETAILKARELKPDLILMDIRLKGNVSGIDAANEILKTDRIPIIYLTALSDRETLREAQKSGPFGYVIKPFVSRELEVIIAAALLKENNKQFMKDIEERHLFSLKNFRGISFRSDMNFMPLYIYGSLEDIVGYQSDDFITGRVSWDKIAYPEESPLYSDEIKARFREIPNFQINKELRVISQKGGIKWIRHYVKNVCNERGNPVGIVGTVFDVTEYKEIYESLNKMIINFDNLKKATIGREIMMIELKREVNGLRQELGKLPKYEVSHLDENNN